MFSSSSKKMSYIYRLDNRIQQEDLSIIDDELSDEDIIETCKILYDDTHKMKDFKSTLKIIRDSIVSNSGELGNIYINVHGIPEKDRLDSMRNYLFELDFNVNDLQTNQVIGAWVSIEHLRSLAF